MDDERTDMTKSGPSGWTDCEDSETQSCPKLQNGSEGE